MLFTSDSYREDLQHIIEFLPDCKFSIMVTGASGLIGTCLIDALLFANSYYGRQYTIYAMGRSAQRLRERFCKTVWTEEPILLVQDVCNPINDEIQLDYIVNAASNADPGVYARFPVETILTNIMGTKNVLEYARIHKNTRILFTSTMEVYGQLPKEKNIKEKEYGKIDFNRVRSGYPESKRVSELLCKSYADEYNIDAVIARLGYIYGPTMSETDNKVVAQFIRCILNGEDIVLKSRGEQRRSYCYVSDAVAGICAVLFRGRTGEPYNIASDISITTIADMAEAAAKVGKIRVIYEETDDKRGKNEINDYVLDTSKIQEIGWKPVYDLETGIKNTVNILSI